LVTVNVLEGDGDREVLFNDSDCSDQIGVGSRERYLTPVALSVACRDDIVAAKADVTLSDLVESAKGLQSKEHGVGTLQFGAVRVDIGRFACSLGGSAHGSFGERVFDGPGGSAKR
jgi:hypothetical protein